MGNYTKEYNELGVRIANASTINTLKRIEKSLNLLLDCGVLNTHEFVSLDMHIQAKEYELS